jgi:hypothetical protein
MRNLAEICVTGSYCHDALLVIVTLSHSVACVDSVTTAESVDSVNPVDFLLSEACVHLLKQHLKSGV